MAELSARLNPYQIYFPKSIAAAVVSETDPMYTTYLTELCSFFFSTVLSQERIATPLATRRWIITFSLAAVSPSFPSYFPDLQNNTLFDPQTSV